MTISDRAAALAVRLTGTGAKACEEAASFFIIDTVEVGQVLLQPGEIND